MHPLVRASLGVAALAFLGGFAPPRLARYATPAPAPPSPGPAPAPKAKAPLCPAGTLPDAGVCVDFLHAFDDEGTELVARSNWHLDRRGRIETYDQVPRLPERAADFNAYRYPVASPNRPGGSFVISGYDLDRPNEAQRRGARIHAVGHGGVDLMAPRGAEVRLVTLEHQDGEAEVLHAGRLVGTCVVTRHLVREGGRLRTYLVVYGHLDGIAPGLVAGRPTREGDLLGFVGDTGSEGLVHLHLEVRRVREEREGSPTAPGHVMDQAWTIAVDPRNVLPPRTP
jgi:murein DD-endopeptidase MepM/ murein hydrolase activator NlpD